MSQSASKTDADQFPLPRSRWGRIGFALVNIWLVYHLFCIVIAPASVRPSSRLQQDGWLIAQPYVQSLYLNHGYHYFAPNPGPSTVIEYTLEFADGSTERGQFPHRGISPRLLYHRHFMLTEFMANARPETQELWARSYARNLCREYDAVRVTLTRVRHNLPRRLRVLAGGTLTDEELYDRVPLGTFERDEL